MHAIPKLVGPLGGVLSALAAAFLSLVLAADVVGLASASQLVLAPALTRLLPASLELSTRDVVDVRSARVLSKTLDSRIDQETSVVAIVSVAAPFELVAELYPTPEFSVEAADAVEFGWFSDPPTPDDIATMTLDDRDFAGLSTCRVGSCKLKMPSDWMLRFAPAPATAGGVGALPGGAARAGAAPGKIEAASIYRELLGTYAARYAGSGFDPSSLTLYHDKSNELRIADELAGILEESPYLRLQAPELYDFVAGLAAAPEGARARLLWMKEDIGTSKRVTTLVHQIVYRPPGRERVTILNKQLYGNHYFEAALSITHVIPHSLGRGAYLLHIYRARIDRLRGWGLFHGRIRSGIRNRIGERMDQARQRFEAAGEASAVTASPSITGVAR